jgi:metal-responsive CopG/Arc/MetJ family transcriptional regulator
MGKSTGDTTKRKRRPPATGVPVQVRLQPEMLAGVDQFVAEHNDISRPEAVRMIIQDWMEKHQVISGE